MEYQDKIDILEIRNKRYKQTLQEIREIAGSIIGNANATYTDFYNKLSDILDLITKAEEE